MIYKKNKMSFIKIHLVAIFVIGVYPVISVYVRKPVVKYSSLSLLNSISSYLVRSIDADEQNVFSSIVGMNPGRFDFNLHSFRYGGLFSARW